jgi:hypothetical protein
VEKQSQFLQTSATIAPIINDLTIKNKGAILIE